MKDLSPTLQAKLRSSLHWSADGISLLVGGLACLLFGSGMFLSRYGTETPLRIFLIILCFVLWFPISLRHSQIVEWLKSRITYPRTGYVLPPYLAENKSHPLALAAPLGCEDAMPPGEWQRVRKDRNRRVLLMFALIALPLSAMTYVHNRWILFAAGIAMSVALWIGTWNVQRLPWVLLPGFPLLGLYMTISAPEFVGVQRFGLFFAGSGALLVLQGALSLFQFLHRNPRPFSLTP
jgi:hypothetical protein